MADDDHREAVTLGDLDCSRREARAERLGELADGLEGRPRHFAQEWIQEVAGN
jgi:hypothetical protein